MMDELDHLRQQQLDWDFVAELPDHSFAQDHILHHRTAESVFDKFPEGHRPKWPEASRVERVVVIAAFVAAASFLAWMFVSISAEQAKIQSVSGLQVRAASPCTDKSRP